jgi:hypothetical protein
VSDQPKQWLGLVGLGPSVHPTCISREKVSFSSVHHKCVKIDVFETMNVF